MKRLLAILGAFGLTATGATTVVACNNNKVADNDLAKIKSITAPAAVTAANSESVTKEEVKTALAANVLSAVQGIAKTAKADDFTYDVFKDSKGTAYSNVNLKTGTADVYVKITAAKDKKVVINSTGYIKVTLPKEGTVVKQSIAGATVTDLKLAANTGQTYADLLKDQTLIDAVVAGIKTETGLDTTVTTDFTLGSNKAGTDNQAAGTVTITVTAKGNKIEGTFTFDITLELPAPSKKSIAGATVTDLKLAANTGQTYADLLKDQTLIDAVVAGIKTETGLDTTVTTDFTLGSNKAGTDNQAAGTVTITVTAKGNKIEGTFTFDITLELPAPSKKSIAGATVTDLKLAANTGQTYADLLKDQTLIDAVVAGIKTETGLDTTVTTDFTLGSNKAGTDNQAAGTVTITVTAKGNKIEGTFTFDITLT
ncbi:spiralin lipoprotein [Spiroplasma sp. SV19]|uniref:spiralin lipoprotein n=1 Tax=Spiroplasma sp. SV19 TaxID=2570468 RepID=UPI0024B6E12E|nr:spiralin lipoprotein [Spiroplasma sp. SV19]